MNKIFRHLFCKRVQILAIAVFSLAGSSCKTIIADSVRFSGPDTSINPSALHVSSKNYDTGRTGANTRETVLNQSNVRPGMFGKIAELYVDDEILAGLLYISGLYINGQNRNVLFAATVNNTLYAFDVDELGAPLWERNVSRDFNVSGRPSHYSDVNFNGHINFSGNLGIVGTPVIDISTKTMYFVTRTEEDGVTVQRLWAIDITDGKNRVDPIVIASNAFTALKNNHRAALAYGNNTVYVAWAAYGDATPYHGVVHAYDSNTLTLTGIFNVTPSGEMGGIWMGGGAPAMDAEGNLYYATGNGTWNGVTDFGNSVVKLKARTLEVLDWFTPYDYERLNIDDADLGASFPVILPGLNMLAIAGKGRKLYLLNSANLGKMADQDTQIPQSYGLVGHHIQHGVAAWQGPNGVTLYTWTLGDGLRAYRFDPTLGKFILPSIAEGTVRHIPGPGGVLAISSDGDKAGTGIVWATVPRDDAWRRAVPGRFLAFSSEEVEGELPLLWTSDRPEDDMYNFSKGAPPLVVNGRVFVPSLSNAISVYGLKSASD